MVVVVPIRGAVLVIETADVPVLAFQAYAIPNVADIWNPRSAPGSLWVDVTGAGATIGGCLEIPPGGAYRISRKIAAEVTVTSATAGHAYYAVAY